TPARVVRFTPPVQLLQGVRESRLGSPSRPCCRSWRVPPGRRRGGLTHLADRLTQRRPDRRRRGRLQGNAGKGRLLSESTHALPRRRLQQHSRKSPAPSTPPVTPRRDRRPC